MRSPRVPLALLATVLPLATSTAAAPAAQVCASPGLAFGGANGPPAAVTATIDVTESVVIGDLTCRVRFAHAWAAEVDLELTSPAGTKLALKKGDGGPRGHDVTYADAGVPYDTYPFDLGLHMRAAGGSLDVFDGESSQGTWTLTLTDTQTSWNDGVLQEWCLDFHVEPQPTKAPPIRDLVPAPVPFGAELTWTNGAAYDAIEVLVEGAPVATLPGSATSASVAGLAPGGLVEVAVRPIGPGGAEVDVVGYDLRPLGPPPAPRTEKVVFVLIDGLRYSEGLGHPARAYVPRMAALAEQGTIVEPFRCDGPSVTLASLPALATGTWKPSARFFDESCQSNSRYMPIPTIHEAFRRQLGRPASDCQYVIGVIGCAWSGSFHPSYGADHDPMWVATTGLDEDVFAASKQAIVADEPSLLTMYLYEVDGAGHSGNFQSYLDAIGKADQIVGDLWDFLQSRPAYAGKTTMIVTNDHGRHDDDFRGHGDACEGCRNIQLLAVGPGIRRGHVSTIQRSIPDVAPTIARLLGFETEYADGDVMTEILETCQADLGFGGPGAVSLAVCGDPLVPGGVAEMRLAGGPAGAAALLVASTGNSPTPALGGTLAAWPPGLVLPVVLDPAGALEGNVVGALGPLSIRLQAVVEDASQPAGAAISNAVRLDFGAIGE